MDEPRSDNPLMPDEPVETESVQPDSADTEPDDVEVAGPESAAPPPRPLDLTIDAECCTSVNFAALQHRVPLVERLSLTNCGDVALTDVLVEVSLANGECEPWSTTVARVGPGETYRLEPEGLALDVSTLAERTESERTRLHVSVLSELAGSPARTEGSFDIDLLAFDHWGGLLPFPELLAAFATPNHPAVAPLLGRARELLERDGHDPAIDGYQSGSRRRAVALAEACYGAVAAEGLGYINPPASFEKRGQRVRLIDRVMGERQGTCLDLALLLAGVWEQAGLNALVIFFEDHALPAIWTHDEHFPEPIVDEVQRLRNHAKLGELVPVESTKLTRAGVGFGDAVAAAMEKLAGAGGEVFAVDIKTARRLGVRPLPLRVEPEGAVIEPDALRQPVGARVEAVELAERADERTGEAIEVRAPDRVDRWKRKLLDLSLRNRLLNFRETGRTIGLAAPDISALEDALAGGASFDLLPRPPARGPEGEGEFDESFRLAEMGSGRVFTEQTEAESSRRLLEMYRASRSSIEETGANVLHLALGMLHWYESPTAEEARRAPLILLPMRLVRRTGGGGYRYGVELTSEPVRPNITLLEKLRVEFGMDVSGLEELPEDERGIDVPLIMRRFREAIRDTARWEVAETAYLGLFSFNKFLMWRDLQQHGDRLRESAVVRHMVETPGRPFEQDALPDAAILDDAPGRLLCTRDADSSQLSAVLAASEGRTFVLEGPPGTGKSQTIANIIANSLAQGKRVLFVAEKMAALSVVRRRLEQDGLGPFCLELHSAKASKKEVLRQLGEAIDGAGVRAPAEWERTGEELDTERRRLNEYVEALHAPRASGESLYEMIGRLAVLSDGASIAPDRDDVTATTAEELREWREAIDALEGAGAAVTPVGEHPLRGVTRSEWSFGLPGEADEVIAGARARASELRGAIEGLVRALGVEGHPGSELSGARVRVLCEAARLLRECPGCEHALLEVGDIESTCARLRSLVDRDRALRERRGALLGRYRPELLDRDLLAMRDAARAALAKHPLIRWLYAGKATKPVRQYCLKDEPPLREIVADLNEAIAVRDEARSIEEASASVPELLGAAWGGADVDHDAMHATVRWASEFVTTLLPLRSEECGGRVAAAMLDVASDASARPIRDHAIGAACARLVEAWENGLGAWTALDEVLAVDPESAWGGESAPGWLPALEAALERWGGNLKLLNDWCAWRGACDRADRSGLAALVRACERNEVQLSELSDVFERGFGERWLNSVADDSPAIRSFNPAAHERAGDRFRRLDREFIELTRTTVASRLAERVPAGERAVSSSSEVGILRRELEKRSRHLPTRRLIESLPNLLPRMKPCFLMSPLSVAQYLDPELPPFDIVVFDEASQIPVWDAIGAVARGTSVIVVGDSKQLPPTNFFNSIDAEDEGSELLTPEDDELESILQESNACGLPALRLRWHYRSRHESLITFSNHHYYDDELHTFPSPVQSGNGLGVSLRVVEGGRYDRGGTRTNRAEAAAVVDEVVRRLREEPGRSIGIVTFNINQQGLIEDMLDERRRESPELEGFFTSSDEPVFVKNLENVQGDERDVIVFSVGYGPDERGRMSMNFGPLNGDGGERRLNVAITRARYELVVFSSMGSDAIDLSRTRATGVRHFKTYLDYAARGPGAIAQALAHGDDTSLDGGLEDTIALMLRERGWRVDRRVGCAGYRVDLAVRHPERDGEHALGIECDGPTYADAATARDRDRTRRSVMEGLGWDLERVWSTSWRLDSDACLDRLESAIERAIEPSAEEEAPAEPVEPQVRVEDGDEPASLEKARPTPDIPVYTPAKRPRGVTSSSDVFADRNTARAAAALVAIVEHEAPVVPELVIRRLAEWYGVSRVTDKFRERFNEIRAEAGSAIVSHGDALWTEIVDPMTFEAFRRESDEESSQRDIDWVPLVERAAAVRRALREQIAMPREELEREAARLLGIPRTTSRTREFMAEAIDAVVESGAATESDGRVAIA